MAPVHSLRPLVRPEAAWRYLPRLRGAHTRQRMSDELTSRVVFRVKRITYARRMCSYCGGTAKVTRGYKQETCPECKNGVAVFEHQTEVDLLDALEELKLIKRKNR
ncbi:MAG: hypothetical protein A2W90_14550 [Bacteroidetes bacterium GWF2_42_66]|nr:MAG: hypothetical protein A2W92_15945 [Bacteroidetes bacterium GWA2_42_15]OFX99085.1 MAG: hypothetical protein A2W89_06710 [Bacteroidetes bacterium GWE2_42_39]OFY46746.1 MAG: hypothetical protein A2W90_14550 [Bacteroidetes bacterium GWF2_42_66]HBL73847.1 hypothetical protein [Prolixibacteraceae bacterium]HCU63220.1 hypothetical protein [Prolixibacteraceae bacterium]